MGVERVRDVDDPRLADYRDLRDGERRRRDRTFIAESRQVVRRLLGGSRFRARSLLAAEAAAEDRCGRRPASRPVPARVALLLGAEDEGVRAAARAAADVLVAIRMAGGGHSLNVATASGIALHRFTR